MADVVLDASAVLVLLQDGPGADEIWRHLPGARLSAVNAAEVVAKLVAGGSTAHEAGELLDRLGAEILPFQAADIVPAARLQRGGGTLALGDRACLGLASRLAMPAVTTDRTWAELHSGAEIELVR
jgi:ribonuclease VapC